jgi:hypothetical protein
MGQFALRLDPVTRERWEQAAAREGVSVAEYVRRAVASQVEIDDALAAEEDDRRQWEERQATVARTFPQLFPPRLGTGRAPSAQIASNRPETAAIRNASKVRVEAAVSACLCGFRRFPRPASHAGGHWFKSSHAHYSRAREPCGFRASFSVACGGEP